MSQEWLPVMICGVSESHRDSSIHVPESQYNELQVAENIELQSGVLKSLKNMWMWLFLCVQVGHAWGLSDITQSSCDWTRLKCCG